MCSVTNRHYPIFFICSYGCTVKSKTKKKNCNFLLSKFLKKKRYYFQLFYTKKGTEKFTEKNLIIEFTLRHSEIALVITVLRTNEPVLKVLAAILKRRASRRRFFSCRHNSTSLSPLYNYIN